MAKNGFSESGYYLYEKGERVTPLEEIPIEYRRESKLPNGQIQVTDIRRCYTFHPEYKDSQYPDGAFLECVNLALDELGFFKNRT